MLALALPIAQVQAADPDEYIFTRSVTTVSDDEGPTGMFTGVVLSDADDYGVGVSVNGDHYALFGEGATVTENFFDFSKATISITGINALGGDAAAVWSDDGAATFLLGNIHISGNNAGDAMFGLYLDEAFTGELTVKNIFVQNANGVAHGIIAYGPVDGIINIGNITVSGSDYAGGLLVAHDLKPDTGNGLLGVINVTSTGGDACGIRAFGDASLILTNNNITANAPNGAAVGVQVDKKALIGIVGNVNVIAYGHVGGGGFWFGDDSILQITDGARLVTNGVATSDADLGVVGAGNSFANIGVVNLGTGELVLSALTVAVNTTGSEAGNVEINDYTTLLLYGRMERAAFGGSVSYGGVNDWEDSNIVIKSIDPFWEFKTAHDTSGAPAIILGEIGFREAAYMSDGYLVAMGMHNRNAAWNAVSSHLLSAGGFGNGYRGQVNCDPCDAIQPCDPCGTGFALNGNRNAWVNYIGRGDTIKSGYDLQGDWKVGMDGVQVGADIYRTNKTQFGMLFGYEGGKATADFNFNAPNQNRLKGDDTYLGFYGVQVLRNNVDVRWAFAYGWQEFDMTRHGLNPGDIYAATFKGNTSESNIEFGKRYSAGAWSLRPVVALDIMTRSLKGATEDVAAGLGLEAVEYSKTDFTQVYFRTGAELRFQRKRFSLTNSLNYAYDMKGQEMYTAVSPLAVPGLEIPLVAADFGRSVLSYNLGGTYLIGKRFNAFGGYQAQFVTDAGTSQHAGYVGGGWKW
jgi:hypothetical protein